MLAQCDVRLANVSKDPQFNAGHVGGSARSELAPFFHKSLASRATDTLATQVKNI